MLDYDGWAAMGHEGWGWDDVLPYFIRAEDNERGASELHGAGGPLRVIDNRSRYRTCAAFIEAGVQAGLPANDDFNGPEQDGVGWYQVTQRNGMRCSAAVGYLHPVLGRPNLTLRTDAHVTRLLLDGTRAVGVEVDAGGELAEIRAEREVILSAGTYQSPQILLLSGIGPAAGPGAGGNPVRPRAAGRLRACRTTRRRGSPTPPTSPRCCRPRARRTWRCCRPRGAGR